MSQTPHMCDHCGEQPATVDLGYLQYCQDCFDEAVKSVDESYEEWLKTVSPDPRP